MQRKRWLKSHIGQSESSKTDGQTDSQTDGWTVFRSAGAVMAENGRSLHKPDESV